MPNKVQREHTREMERIKAFRRIVCQKVTDAYHDLKPAIGKGGAVDYEQVFGSGSSPKFKPNTDRAMTSINFVRDVELVAQSALAPHDYAFFKNHFLDNLYCWDVLTDERVRKITARMGLLYKFYGLYPVTKYFQG